MVSQMTIEEDDHNPETPETETVDPPSSEEATEQPEIELEAADKREVTPEDGINDLKKRLEAEKAARTQAEQAKAEAERRAHAAWLESERQKSVAQDSNYQMVLSAISTVETRAESLKAAYIDARNAGDYEKEVEILQALTVNSNHLADLKKGQRAMEEAAKRVKEEPKQAPQADAIEQWAASVTPRSANWLRSHKDALNTPAMQRRVLLAHQVAIDDGLEADSDAYFDFVERQTGLKKEAPKRVMATEEEDSPLSAASAPTPRRSVSPPAAPVSRGTPRGNAVRLTADEREAARISGISEEEYAKHKSSLQRAS